jgi:hypothetical protein
VTEEEIVVHLVGLGAACAVLGLPVCFHALRLMRCCPAEHVRELRLVMAESQLSPLHSLNACTPMAALPEDRSTHPGEQPVPHHPRLARRSINPVNSAHGHIADTTRQGPPAVVVALRPNRSR